MHILDFAKQIVKMSETLKILVAPAEQENTDGK